MPIRLSICATVALRSARRGREGFLPRNDAGGQCADWPRIAEREVAAGAESRRTRRHVAGLGHERLPGRHSWPRIATSVLLPGQQSIGGNVRPAISGLSPAVEFRAVNAGHGQAHSARQSRQRGVDRRQATNSGIQRPEPARRRDRAAPLRAMARRSSGPATPRSTCWARIFWSASRTAAPRCHFTSLARRSATSIRLAESRARRSRTRSSSGFIFDLLPEARQAIVVEVDEARAFAPVKNAPGGARDTPESVQAQMIALYTNWLRMRAAK